MIHYQFETLHPFRDGNGYLGRLLNVLTSLNSGVLSEPILTVSPWFEERRVEYYDVSLRTSTRSDQGTFLSFFSRGLTVAATSTQRQMLALPAMYQSLKKTVCAPNLRSAHALDLVDLAVANPSLAVYKVETALGISYGQADGLATQLTDIGVLDVVGTGSQPRRFATPAAPRILLV